MPRRALFISSLALSLVAAPRPQEDPVMKARAQRASAQGISEGDLPPVPRGIIEPPPLPPPEAHVKDTRKGRRSASKAKHRKGKSVAKKGRGVRSKPKTPQGKAK
ncbi:hypothetical protein [Geothrix edaphica]|uniref:Uncharacterized protein n=1 Tax=Geothrix edaphica TaxID=2927976 RepID=A0ABQ5PY51_9BACT|nr:hypothetical protein [Geothrix edaphica]GLH67293.1 hypothetical protein GETHED_16570 [Geothrix edaphica]